MIEITRVEHLRDRVLRLTFSDDMVGDYDLKPIIDRDAPMVEPLKDPAYFTRVFLEMGALAWPNGLELSSSAIHRRLAEAGLLHSADAAADCAPAAELRITVDNCASRQGRGSQGRKRLLVPPVRASSNPLLVFGRSPARALTRFAGANSLLQVRKAACVL